MATWATSRNGPGIDCRSVSQPLPFTPSSGAATIGTRNCKRYPFADSLEFNRHHAFRVAVARDLDTHYDPD